MNFKTVGHEFSVYDSVKLSLLPPASNLSLMDCFADMMFHKVV